MRLQLEIALELLFGSLDLITRRDVGWILAGYKVCASDRQLRRLIDELKQQKLLEQMGRGPLAQFTITDLGRQRRRVFRPDQQWDQPWNGRWHAFLFDLPVSRHKERMVLWRALRDAKTGLLQRSVWIWPHEVEPLLRNIIQARSLPECFCGFEVARLFLCDNAEVVATVWDFAEITKAHDTYLKHLAANIESLNRATTPQELLGVSRIERNAYQSAFALDPLLPRPLWPKTYKGAQVEQRHQAFARRFAARYRELSVP